MPRRPLHSLWRLFTPLLLLAFLALSGMWVRSYFLADSFPRSQLCRPAGGRALMLSSWRGRVAVQHYWERAPGPEDVVRFFTPRVKGDPADPEFARRVELNIAQSRWWASQNDAHEARLIQPALILVEPARWGNGFGFARDHYAYWPPGRPDAVQDMVAVPYWCPWLLVGLPLAYRLRRWQRGRVKPGHCRRCGYDLRASGARCPECGTAILPAPPARPAGS